MSAINIEKEKKLEHSILTSELSYDCETGVFTWNTSRPGVARGKIAGSKKVDGYIKIRLNKEEYLAHRLAWYYYYQKWPISLLDHIDRNKTNNSIKNLREADTRSNGYNRSDTSIYGSNIYKTKSDKYTILIQFKGNDYSYTKYTTLREAKEDREYILQYIDEFNSIPENRSMLQELRNCNE